MSLLVGDTLKYSQKLISIPTDGTLIEFGTTAQRGTAAQYKIRFNTSTGQYEGSNGTGWGTIGGSGSVNDMFYENTTVTTGSYTLASGRNAMVAGPITVANGHVITISNGAALTIVGAN